MYHSTVASPSHPLTQEFWTPPWGNFSFPTSDLRYTPLRATVPPPTRVPPHYLTASPSLCIDVTTSKYSTSVPLRKEIEPGVWSDGTDRVLSAAYPPVRHFLAIARQRMSLPVPPSELVFVIAALDVFYNRNDPAHWMFWSDEKKYQTAKVVNRIALRSPQLIRSSVAWNGISEYLFILSGLHGSSSLPTDKEWYHILNPSKVPSPPMNLRKRKVQQVEQTEFLDTPEEENDSEVGERRRKRSKLKSARHAKPKTPATPESMKVKSNDPGVSDASPALTFVSLPAKESTASPPTPAPCNTASYERTTSSTEYAVPTQATPLLQKPTGPQSPDPFTLPRATSPKPVIGVITPTSTLPHSRNRSTSQASSQTVVSANERRSVSVLSNVTAVELCTMGGGADEAIKVDQSVSDSEEADGKAEDKSPYGMVTRGRANQARGVVAKGKGVSRPPKPRAKRRAAK